MKPTTYFSLILITIGLALFADAAFSKDINFSDETISKNLLLNKTLNCQMNEQNYQGPEIIKVIEIKGDKFVGHSDFWCWGKGTRYTGKLKKNSLKWSQQEHTGCYCRTGNLNFFKDEKGNLKAEGKYTTGCGSNIFQGTIKCVAIDP